MTASYFTEEGLKNILEEINHLEVIERPKISAQIGEARDKGDLSENAEYDAAKEAQGMLELKISELKGKVANARIVDKSQIDTSKVQLLTTVTVKNKKNGATVSYEIVPDSEADLKNKKIAVNTPMAIGLLGKKIGEIAKVQVPAGLMEFEILDITI
ncbi:MAG: transcription elongation factor GreA [Bacteroidales bacterium]|jgi:transcription elongation factor GreA|nr:transcription elongation factor GreA [Bacteroidales bacterium]